MFGVKKSKKTQRNMLSKKLNLIPSKINALFGGTYNEPNFLAFLRVTVGLIALVDLLSMLPDFRLLFSQHATIVPQEILYLPSEYFSLQNAFYSYLSRNHFETYFYSISFWGYLASLLFLVLGFCSRVTAITALIFQLLIYKSFPEFNYGYDQFITMTLFYCCIFPVGKYYSLDSRFFWKKEKGIVFNYQRVLQIHLCIVYFSSGLAKLLDTDWWNGNSMWKSLCSISNEYYKIPTIFLTIAGIGVVLLEVLYTVLVSLKKTRQIALVLCILMHVSIGFFLDLYPFAAIMAVWNIAAFSNFTVIPKKAA
jgi:uncharacterized membrane protein YphA (DoxX/SURF4 family)